MVKVKVKFIKTKVTQHLFINNNYTAQKVKGYLVGNSGLSLIKSYKSWAVTHERSGMLIFRLSLPFNLVKQIAIEIASLLDWTEHHDIILNQTKNDNSIRHKLSLVRDVKRDTFQKTMKVLKE